MQLSKWLSVLSTCSTAAASLHGVVTCKDLGHDYGQLAPLQSTDLDRICRHFAQHWQQHLQHILTSSCTAAVCVKVRFQLEQTREGLQRQLAATDGQMHVLQARLDDSQAEQQVHL